MCSLYWQRMENNQGDLADIVRTSGGGSTTNNPIIDWQIPAEPMNFPWGIEETNVDFGDPFSTLRDPLLHELDLTGSVFFNRANSSSRVKMNVVEEDNFLAKKILDEEIKRPCNIFSRMLHISPTAKTSISPMVAVASPRGINSSLDTNDMIKANGLVNCPADGAGLQISSPRNPSIKRRKSQAKKVVCIPAPAAVNSRASGEIVPSDLWAWRKYGQKPIKGSPYPRGYYRCSSSKGCPARKQVERSRTDPNMLVITYTSEHNHPWPTQRNALAGSTRSHSIKNNLASKSSPASQTSKLTHLKEETKDNHIDNSSVVIAGGSIGTVKEEAEEIEKPIDVDHREFDQSFSHNYRPLSPDSNQSDDFFADLGELEPDPLNLIFPQGFISDKSEEERINKALDPFNLFDWSGNSYGEAN
ncbi:putative WRKY transcription factor 14 [Tasmannia lanceolata]|uniref:putative WRKY transcription factor 14 n=1 Tax=Tasmannia lanceolata TaxID=3420 RepID=UPI004062C0BD